MANFSLERMQSIQRELQEKYKEQWEPIQPQTARNKLLWMMIEAGEMADVIKKQKDFHIIKEKDYVKNPKKSGYQSIHVIAGVPVTYNDTVTEIRVEIQIRSFAMDYWAELDTQMCYKKDAGQIANVERETRGYSDVIAKVDNKMLELRRQIEMM